MLATRPRLTGSPASGGDDRNRCGCVFGRAGYLLAAGGHDHRYLPTNEIVGERRQEFIVSASPARLDCNILTIGEAGFAKPALDAGEPRGKSLGRTVRQKSD